MKNRLCAYLRTAAQTVISTSLFLVTSSVRAQNIPGVEYEKFLLPTVVVAPQPGAFGSLWVTRVTITNASQEPVYAFPNNESPGQTPIAVDQPLPPNSTIAAGTGADGPDRRGAFFFVDKRFVQQVQISLRVQDLSRQSLTWGSSLPVPRVEEFTTGSLTLNDIPIESRFRQTLRIYSSDSSRPSTVRISLYGVTLNTASTLPQQDVLLGSADRALLDHRDWLPVNTVTIPGFLEISDLKTIAPISDYDFVRVTVASLDGSEVWAFATITNDETQHVTVIAPTR